MSESLLEIVHRIGREVAGPHAAAVDKEGRFPAESFAALKAAKLLSCYVPAEYGGMGVSFTELTRMCEVLGQYCANTAMVFSMHQIQVACICHHALGAPYFQAFVRELVEKQLLIGSATTEAGIGGDVRSSRCAVSLEGDRFTLVKEAPVISYAEASDVILVTARRTVDSLPSDQVHVLTRKATTTLTQTHTWDTLGFRGTVSTGYILRAEASVEQILPAPYAVIHAQTMQPFSHITWAALWCGLAGDAMNHARAFVRGEARKTPGTLPPGALRLAEADVVYTTFKSTVYGAAAEYEALLAHGDPKRFEGNLGFALQLSNVKVAASQLVIDVVSRALMICGISAYRNDHPGSLCRQLRDAYGASLMVNNDRILGQCSTIQIARREF